MNRIARSLILAAPIALAACVEQEDTSLLFQARSSTVSSGASTPILVRERRLAFLADELTTGLGGTDMNEDGDKQYDHSFIVQGFRFGAPGRQKREEFEAARIEA